MKLVPAKDQIHVLKCAQESIAEGSHRFICFALSDFVPRSLQEQRAVVYLKTYIENVLGLRFSSLDFWLEAQGYFPDRRGGAAKIRHTRLAWIDWMIKCLEEDSK